MRGGGDDGVEELARRHFCAARVLVPRAAAELLVLSTHGKGVVMRLQALRPTT